VVKVPEIEPPAGLVQKLYLIPETASARKKTRLSGWKFWLRPAFQPVLTSLTVILVAFSLLTFTTPGKSLKRSATLELRQTYSLARKTLVRAGVLKDKLQGYAKLSSLPLKLRTSINQTKIKWRFNLEEKIKIEKKTSQVTGSGRHLLGHLPRDRSRLQRKLS